jgi:eukaryotic-like serine/threonine-protein kinase
MGIVYLAREYASGRLVAMKFLRHPGDRSASNRFLVELRALAGVDHPGVVRVFASDFLRPDPFFTMEFLSGGSLTSLMAERGTFDPMQAARLIAAAARAVHAAHDAGVIHRDLKPSNILLTEDGTPKVSDFGLAKRPDSDDAITTSSGPVGTPGYMAPEQASRHYGPPGPTADVYGLGATLYHMLTGCAPFSGDHLEVVNQLLTTPPVRPRAIRPDIPQGLEAVALKCLEKQPTHRYQTAADLAADLDRFLAGQKTTARPLTRTRRIRQAVGPRLAPIGLAALLLVCVFALGAAVWPRPKDGDIRQPADPVAEARKELASGRPVTLIGKTGLPAYSRWVLEPSVLGESPLGDRTCSFSMFGYGMLELFPAPGISHYQIDLELRHLESQAGLAAGNPAEIDFLGVYFGYATAPATDGSPTHGMFSVSYRDSDRDAFLNGLPPRLQPVFLSQYGFHQSGTELPKPLSEKVEALQFTPSRFRPGDWRPISIECAPDHLLVQWKNDAGKMVPLADWPKTKLLAQFDTVRTGMGKLAPGAEKTLPRWNPDAPFGLIGYKASLAVRNVVITPLP